MKRTYFRLLAGFATVLFCAVLGFAQAPTAGKIRILGLSIMGNETTDAGLIRAHSGLRVGDEVTGDDIQTAIEQLWKLNLFSDIQIVEERDTPEGVYLAVRVAEYPRLERLDVHGNRKLKGDDLKTLLVLTPGQVVEPRDVVQLKNRLLKKYHDMGYLLAEVEVNSFQSTAAGKLIVDVRCKEGKKVKIRGIAFEGNTAFKDAALRKRMKDTKRKTFLRSGEFKRDKLDADKQAVADYYRSRGYRDAEITADSLRYSDDRRGIFLTFYVNEGPVYHFGKFTWSGNKLFTTQQLAARLRVEPGDLYNGQKLQQSLADIGSMYYEKGYIYASVSPNEKVSESDTVDVALEVVEGGEFKVNRIFIEGNTKTKEKVIRRELVLYPGETFDVSKLQRSIREVTILNYFANVTPDVVPISENQVDLYLKLEEKSTDQANVSAGYSQRDKFIGSVGFQMNNLLGNGQQLSLDWNFGKVYRSFSVSFTEPWFRNSRTLVGASFYDTYRSGTTYGFDENVLGGTLRAGRRLRWPDDYFRLDYIYRLDRTIYSNFTAAFRSDNPRNLPEDKATVSSSVTQIVSRDSRNDPEFPSKGSVNSLRTELAGGPMGGNNQFIKAELSNQWYVPVVGNLTLMASSNLGVLDALTANPNDIRYFDFFFMGGSGLTLGTPLRGYKEQDVGPQTLRGYPVGGKTLFKQSFELRYPIVRNPTIFALTFAEAGNVWRNFEETDPTDLRRSVGLGARLFMPFIGMIGLDYGWGLDHYDARSLRQTRGMVHFQFGRGF